MTKFNHYLPFMVSHACHNDHFSGSDS